MKSLLTLLLLTCLGMAAKPEPAPRKVTDEELKEALKFADKWQVPQPTGKVMKEHVGTSIYQGFTTNYYNLGFYEPGEKPCFRAGFKTEEIRRPSDVKEVPNPDDLELDEIHTPELVMGFQLVRAGYPKLGRRVLEEALNRRYGIAEISKYVDRDKPLVVHLAKACLEHELRGLDARDPNFALVMARMRCILAEQPEFRDSYRFAFESMQASLAHRPARPGSVESAIDEFLLSGIRAEGQRWGIGEFDPREKQLILLGFKAVPALLKQRNSIRATNHSRIGFNNFPSFRLVAGQAISDYLQRLANDESASGWIVRQQGGVLDDDTVDLWWERAAALGEAGYVQKFTVQLVSDVLEEQPPISDARISNELLLLATERYPQYLPEMYRKLLPTKHYSHPLLTPIMKSKDFSAEQKFELVMAGIATNHEAHRNDALEALYELRPKDADAVLAKMLRAAPAKVVISGRFDHAETQNVYLANFVAQTKDPQVWQEYLALLTRAEPELQLELIDKLIQHETPPISSLRAWQPVYDRFRDDPAQRDGCRFTFAAAHEYPTISVRNYIHLQWNEWLQLELPPPPKPGTELEWENYRAVVAQAVQKKLAAETK